MKKIFRNAIVRKPCAEMVEGITSAKLGKPDYKKALEQHINYTRVLADCGLNVTVLPPDNRFPDSCFIEDVSLCTPNCAIITNPGAESRNGEKLAMRPILQEFYKNMGEIKYPGTLDAGDVMMVGNHYYIGISDRTNQVGADQLIAILQKYELTGSAVPLKTMLHLKTGLSYLEENNLLITGEFTEMPEFEKYNRIFVDTKEAYAANSLWINGHILVPKGFPDTLSKIEKAGYHVIEVDVSEFQKLDGGLSCLSLRF